MPDVVCFLVEKLDERDIETRGVRVFGLRRVDTGEIVARETYGLFVGDGAGQVLAGAMLWVMHRPGGPHLPLDHRDGTERHLLVATPGGVWCTGCPASSGAGRWEITGEPPLVTASPSIEIPGRYHGWLRDGRLIDA